jgi:hypothetical protein
MIFRRFNGYAAMSAFAIALCMVNSTSYKCYQMLEARPQSLTAAPNTRRCLKRYLELYDPVRSVRCSGVQVLPRSL